MKSFFVSLLMGCAVFTNTSLNAQSDVEGQIHQEIERRILMENWENRYM